MLIRGDLFDVLPTLDAESIDAGVTDPPYGIGFMGREWDTFKPEAGAKRLARAKAQREKNRAFYEDNPNPNLRRRQRSPALSSSAVAYDESRDGLKRFQEWTERWAIEVLRVLKPGAHLLVCGAPRSFHRMGCGVEDAGFIVRDCLSWLYGQGFPKSLNLPGGLGTALKPGWEPILVARKPFKGSIAANVAKHGTGALNIDATRIEGPGWSKQDGATGAGFKTGKFMGAAGDGEPTQPDGLRESTLGRWPANVLLDEEAAALLDEQTGELQSGGAPLRRNADKFRNSYGTFKGTTDNPIGIGASEGGASRFYYVAKPSREERDYGTDGLIARQRDESRKEGNPGGDNPRNRGLQPRGNFHPTVKPVELMRWLVKLVTPLGGTVLDPFTGSGTTGMACRYEQREFIGIEREAEYAAIAERRIAAVAPLFAEQSI
jgi:DNA modification methylase